MTPPTPLRAPLLLALLVLASAGCAGLVDERRVPLRTLDVGHTTAIREAMTRVVDDADAFRALWEEHARPRESVMVDGRPLSAGPRPLPEVDFGRERVLAAYLGEREDTCHHVRIAEARATRGGLDVVVRAHGPPGSACGLTVVHPFHLVAVERAGEVRFHHENATGAPADVTSKA